MVEDGSANINCRRTCDPRGRKGSRACGDDRIGVRAARVGSDEARASLEQGARRRFELHPVNRCEPGRDRGEQFAVGAGMGAVERHERETGPCHGARCPWRFCHGGTGMPRCRVDDHERVPVIRCRAHPQQLPGQPRIPCGGTGNGMNANGFTPVGRRGMPARGSRGRRMVDAAAGTLAAAGASGAPVSIPGRSRAVS